MSCRRAYEIDIAAYLANPRAAEFAAFRAHYPACAPCSAELRAWTELTARLGAGRAAHPAPALLLRFEDAADRLEPAARDALRAHLAGCASCRDELAGLRAFQPALDALPAAPASREGRGLAAALRALLWQPAFAYAVAFVLAAPLLYLQVTRDRLDLRPPRSAPATTPAPEARPAPPPARPSPLAPAPARPAPKPEPAPAKEVRKEPAARPRIVVPPADKTTSAPKTDLPREDESAGPIPSSKKEPSSPEVGRLASPRARSLREGSPAPDALRSLGYIGSASEGAPSGAGAAPDAVALRSDDGGDVLTIPLDPDGGASEVRIESPDGARSIVERFPGGATRAELRLPHGWIGAGRYRVVVRSERGEREYFLER